MILPARGQFGVRKEIKDLAAGVNDLARVEQGEKMMQKTGLVVLMTLLALATAGCAPLLIGGAGAVVADEVIEQDQGGDGLF
ncbi:MAG: hypothetical protein FD150_978 [Rhodobacteraceae bacterium]|nr:MAG: hypothetical protein FD150_978 [Paracoccaceae bacterium]